jgi:hypothetical protein
LQTNLSNAYDAIEEKGGTLPANKNMNNLADSIANIPEANYTLMGNELRRAYGWTHEEDVSGTCQIYNPYRDIFSSSFTATNIKGLIYNNNITSSNVITPAETSYAIIDGKLYLLSIQSNTIILTQQGTATDWEDTNGTIFVKNGKIYFSYSTANNNQTPYITAINPKFSSIGYCGNIFINDNKLYNGNTLIDGSGIWTDLKSWLSSAYYDIGLRNNKLYFYSANGIKDTGINYIITDGNLYGKTAGNCYFAIDNTLYTFSYNYNTGTINGNVTLYNTYSSKIKKVSTGYNFPAPIVLLENGDLYYLKVKKASNIINYITYNGTYFLSNDCKIYDYNGNIIRSMPTNIIKTQGIAYSCFKYINGTIGTNRYTISYINNITKAYAGYENEEGIELVNSASVNNIYINSLKYTRNPNIDSIFTFIPEDLENCTFSDADLIRAYLDAGLKQGNE